MVNADRCLAKLLRAMNHEVQDTLMFDRLVDGELSTDQRQVLLASLDERPEAWRRLALAFVEAQTWQNSMRRIVAPQEPQLIAPAAPSPSEERSAAVARPSRSRRSWHLAAGPSLAIAAGLLLAFTVGWQLGPRESAPTAEMAAAPGGAPPVAGLAQDAPAMPRGAAAPGAPAGGADAVTLVVHDSRGVAQRVQVPLVDGRQLGRQFDVTPHWAAPAVRQRLAEQGVDLQARRRYAPLYFEQHDQLVPMIVPVDDAVITPVSRPIY